MHLFMFKSLVTSIASRTLAKNPEIRVHSISKTVISQTPYIINTPFIVTKNKLISAK